MLKLYHLTLNNKNMINNHRMGIGFIILFFFDVDKATWAWRCT
jgi:hypothetical protein